MVSRAPLHVMEPSLEEVKAGQAYTWTEMQILQFNKGKITCLNINYKLTDSRKSLTDEFHFLKNESLSKSKNYHINVLLDVLDIGAPVTSELILVQ